MNDDLLREVLAQLRALTAKVELLEEMLTHRERVLVGWKAIGEYVGLSEDRAKHLGQDPHDPIPYALQGGHAVARATLLDAWMFRRTVPAQRRAKVQPSPTSPPKKPEPLPLFDGTPRRGRSSDGAPS